MEITIKSKFENFLADPDLAKAIELSRRVDDVFDILHPTENQHSCMLQWLLDPREGHGQGEAIFKDFLNAIHYVESQKKEAKQQKLFSSWHPGRVAISGFQSLIVVREKSMVGNGRQDLLLVDPLHKFVILVENKAGSSWKAAQLRGYRESLMQLVRKGCPFFGYQIGLVRIDRYKDEDGTAEEEYGKWAYLDYNWLELAARRAEVRIARGGDVGNQLVIAYCRRQAGYESGDELQLDRLLANLVQHHRDVASAISLSRRRKRPAANDLSLDSFESQIWVWTHQYKDIAHKLDEQKSFSYIKHSVREGVEKLAPKFDVRRSDIYVIAGAWDKLRDPLKNVWPLRIKLREISVVDESGNEEQQKYSIALELVHDNLIAGLDTKIRNVLAKKYDKEMSTRVDANIRRMGRQRNIAKEKLSEKVIEFLKSVNELLEREGVLD